MKRFCVEPAPSAAAARRAGRRVAQDAEAEVAVEAEPTIRNTGGAHAHRRRRLHHRLLLPRLQPGRPGLIIQPYVTITFDLVDKRQLHAQRATSARGTASTRRRPAPTATGPSAWYESDIFGGLDYVFGKFTVGAVYTLYTYPNGAFDTIQEIGFKVGYDDTDMHEGQGSASRSSRTPASTSRPTTATAPRTPTSKSASRRRSTRSSDGGDQPISLSVPIAVGMSLDDYYLDDGGDNELLGYGSHRPGRQHAAGAAANVRHLDADRRRQYLQLFADSVETANDGGDDNEIIGKVGVSFAY